MLSDGRAEDAALFHTVSATRLTSDFVVRSPGAALKFPDPERRGCLEP